MNLAQSETGALPWVPELSAPDYLRKRCDEMKASAPNLGLGFKRSTVPLKVQERLVEHFRSNLSRFGAEGAVDEIRTTVNSSIPTLFFEDFGFNAWLALELKPLHEEWARMPLTVSSCYGIRCYQRGTFLYNHVDREPLYVSSSLCVEQSLDAPWPIHIEDSNGKVNQVHLQPGELLFYEGMRLPHGRPYPLKGDFYAGIFLHYSPAGR